MHRWRHRRLDGAGPHCRVLAKDCSVPSCVFSPPPGSPPTSPPSTPSLSPLPSASSSRNMSAGCAPAHPTSPAFPTPVSAPGTWTSRCGACWPGSLRSPRRLFTLAEAGLRVWVGEAGGGRWVPAFAGMTVGERCVVNVAPRRGEPRPTGDGCLAALGRLRPAKRPPSRDGLSRDITPTSEPCNQSIQPRPAARIPFRHRSDALSINGDVSK